jgi:PhzF family phenazine biosynthesis protein
MSRPSFSARTVRVFAGGDGIGGNPAPIVLDAAGMNDQDMMALAAASGHESGFVVPTSLGTDFGLRFFVPRHEMEMCGHATVGALWCLRQAGRWLGDSASVETLSGRVHGFVRHAGTPQEIIEITQPPGTIEVLDVADDVAQIADALGVSDEDLLPLAMLNSSTSRVKTLIGIRSVEVLDSLQPSFDRVQGVCEAIGSTGLYPFAIESLERRVFHARQFPKASGYPEDAATGIAAAALLFGLRRHGLVAADEEVVTVHQGRAMGHPSEIRVRFELDSSGQPRGCFLGGRVVPAEI